VQYNIVNVACNPLSVILPKLFQTLQAMDKKRIFAQPVTPEEVPDYTFFVKNPMDFATIRQK